MYAYAEESSEKLDVLVWSCMTSADEGNYSHLLQYLMKDTNQDTEERVDMQDFSRQFTRRSYGIFIMSKNKTCPSRGRC